MKIGIVTQPLQTNYGGLLQNYALQQVLKRLGHQPITLNINTSISKWKMHVLYSKFFILKLIKKDNNYQLPFHLNEEKKAIIRQHTNRFIEKYIEHTEELQHPEEFRNYTIKNKLEALIVGSDQVWRPIYNHNILCSFFDFAKGLPIKRIAYAASFGVDEWEFNNYQTLICRNLIKDFNFVSVREKSGINLCKDYLYQNAVHVLDPTMLLDKEDYIKLVEIEKEPISKGQLFTYILDESEEKKEIIDKIASYLNLSPFSSMPKYPINRETIKNNLNDCVYPTVTQWIRSFIDAEFVICDSFHGAVFSIIFNKSFLIIGNKERGMTRFNSLLDTFELRNRIISNSLDIHSIVNTPINWDKVNQIRSEMKIFSINHLKSI